MASGAPDYERVFTLVAPVVGVGAPDWERTAVGPGGASLGPALASTTHGAAQTITTAGVSIAKLTIATTGKFLLLGSGVADGTTSDYCFFDLEQGTAVINVGNALVSAVNVNGAANAFPWAFILGVSVTTAGTLSLLGSTLTHSTGIQVGSVAFAALGPLG